MAIFFSRIVFLTLMFAFATSGFAHRFVSPDDAAALRSAAALGFTAADICGGSDGDDPAETTCDACVLAASFALPPADVTAAAIVSGPAITLNGLVHVCAPARIDHSLHPARAPPVV